MNTEDKNWRLSYNPLHLKYWIFILILLIVGLFSYFYSGDDNLTSMIAFATTIASIILSVLAIFMTLLSNNSIGGMLHKVRDLHDTVLSIPNSLDVSISDLRETTSGLLAVNSEVNKAISTLGNRLEDLEKHLAQNEIKMDNILNSLSTDISGNSHSYENPTEKQIDQYLNTLSLNGIYLLFGIYKYQEKSRNFLIRYIFKKYIWGGTFIFTGYSGSLNLNQYCKIRYCGRIQQYEYKKHDLIFPYKAGGPFRTNNRHMWRYW